MGKYLSRETVCFVDPRLPMFLEAKSTSILLYSICVKVYIIHQLLESALKTKLEK